jgi:crotonobetainyl-CoA:carnitine CoA-transferase CaiB-like acyl-CoA transferase
LYSPHYQTYNRNKRSLTLDTGVPSDLKLLDTLVSEADVFIQNFRPGVAEEISVGAERLQRINPALVYCSISGFGPDGPDAGRPAYDTVAQAASGWLRLLINPENPRVVGPAIADAVTGFMPPSASWARFTSASAPAAAGAWMFRCWKRCAISISTTSRISSPRTR